MRRLLVLALFLGGFGGLSLSSPAHAEDTSARRDGLVVRSYPLGLVDVETAAAIARRLISAEGLVVEDARNHRLVVHDRPEAHRRIAAALADLDATAANVRITVTHEYDRTGRNDHLEADLRGRIGVRGGSSRSTAQGRTQQQLTVLSGSRASITVAEQVPYSEWFWTWGQAHGLWGKGGWSEGVAWRDVGASLLVEPTVLDGGRIRVRLTPQFSYFLDRQRLTTEVHELSTEVVVREGEEIDLGGVPLSDQQFRERFLIGFDRSGATQRVNIRLRAAVVPL